MTYTLKDLKKAVENSKSYSAVLSKLGKNKTGASYKILKNKIKELNLDISHFTSRPNNSGKFRLKKHWTEILICDESKSYRENGARLRKALIESGRHYRCEGCGNTGIWNDQKIILEVDHKDGSWQNNQPDNLRFLCPNCHSQTKNYYNVCKPSYCICGKLKFRTSNSCLDCGRYKNRKIKNRPCKEILIQDFKELKSYVKVAKKYNVSDKSIRKWVKSYGILPEEINRNI